MANDRYDESVWRVRDGYFVCKQSLFVKVAKYPKASYLVDPHSVCSSILPRKLKIDLHRHLISREFCL